MAFTRRGFLHRALHAGAALAIGCGPARGDGTDPDDTAVCKDPLASGELVRTLRFEDENQVVYDQRWQQGWNGGLNADLSALKPDKLLMTNERFFCQKANRAFFMYTIIWI